MFFYNFHVKNAVNENWHQVHCNQVETDSFESWQNVVNIREYFSLNNVNNTCMDSLCHGFHLLHFVVNNSY